MKAHTIFSAIFLVVFAILQGTSAQYDEICHWQCDVIHCDYYYDYCDYDCYEVCYPYAARNQNRQAATGGKTNAALSFQQKGDQSASQSTKQQESERTGKVVRMRIENPTSQSVQRGRIVGTRGSNPRSFALMQTCLSNQMNRQSSGPVGQLS